MNLHDRIEAAREVFASLGRHRDQMERVAHAMVEAIRGGHKILTCGNGGSAAEAMHLSTELVGRYDTDRRSLPALFLGGDATLVTCVANDFGWDEVFTRALRGHGRPGDLLVVFSTSGKSRNVVRALEVAREMGIESAALLGKGGGPCRGLATWEIVVDSAETARIQEAHQFILHVLCDEIDRALAVPDGPAS